MAFRTHFVYVPPSSPPPSNFPHPARHIYSITLFIISLLIVSLRASPHHGFSWTFMTYTSCCCLDVKCLIQARLFKQLVLLRQSVALVEEVGHQGWDWPTLSPGLFPYIIDSILLLVSVRTMMMASFSLISPPTLYFILSRVLASTDIFKEQKVFACFSCFSIFILFTSLIFTITLLLLALGIVFSLIERSPGLYYKIFLSHL